MWSCLKKLLPRRSKAKSKHEQPLAWWQAIRVRRRPEDQGEIFYFHMVFFTEKTAFQTQQRFGWNAIVLLVPQARCSPWNARYRGRYAVYLRAKGCWLINHRRKVQELEQQLVVPGEQR